MFAKATLEEIKDSNHTKWRIIYTKTIGSRGNYSERHDREQ